MAAAEQGSAGERDHLFAPVLRDEDEELATDEERAEGREVSGTGVPDTPTAHPDALPPTEDGVREADRRDDTGDVGRTARPGRPK
ncbi:MAG: hypothetical protein ACJ72W_07705 [Actinoallomurus sp.]